MVDALSAQWLSTPPTWHIAMPSGEGGNHPILAKPVPRGHDAREWCRSTSSNSGSLLQNPRINDQVRRQANLLTPLNLISDQALNQNVRLMVNYAHSTLKDRPLLDDMNGDLVAARFQLNF
ncbi:MAG: hypothetical protein Q8R44_00040 [Novosphingobium sp.]|nr:hypothetical protein [Novosphingobium sp.]